MRLLVKPINSLGYMNSFEGFSAGLPVDISNIEKTLKTQEFK